LKRFPGLSTIIFLGGDPLVLKPAYYFDIINFLEENNFPATLDFTTNLWAFYKNPDRWTPLFTHPRVAVATSFNYGNTRQIAPGVPYTEKMFWKVSNLFLERVGYRPGFISVITDENKDTAINNVRLAQKMAVECKLNHARGTGRTEKPFPISHLYELYLEIIESGLQEWESNSQELIRSVQNTGTICPLLTNCDDHIRVLTPDGKYFSCDTFADDLSPLSEINFDEEVLQSGKIQNPLSTNPDLFSMKDECITCPLFKICNGCKKNVEEFKLHGMIEEHCTKMKSISARILEL
jgi:radical SAM protein with 4Fe4S-binding SPASM domain